MTFSDRYSEFGVGEIDLETEEFIYRGARLTEERAAERAEQALDDARRRTWPPARQDAAGRRDNLANLSP